MRTQRALFAVHLIFLAAVLVLAVWSGLAHR